MIESRERSAGRYEYCGILVEEGEVDGYLAQFHPEKPMPPGTPNARSWDKQHVWSQEVAMRTANRRAR